MKTRVNILKSCNTEINNKNFKIRHTTLFGEFSKKYEHETIYCQP